MRGELGVGKKGIQAEKVKSTCVLPVAGVRRDPRQKKFQLQRLDHRWRCKSLMEKKTRGVMKNYEDGKHPLSSTNNPSIGRKGKGGDRSKSVTKLGGEKQKLTVEAPIWGWQVSEGEGGVVPKCCDRAAQSKNWIAQYDSNY